MLSNPRHGSPPRLIAHQPTRAPTTQESSIRVHRPESVSLQISAPDGRASDDEVVRYGLLHEEELPTLDQLAGNWIVRLHVEEIGVLPFRPEDIGDVDDARRFFILIEEA